MRRFFQRSGLAPTDEAGAMERLVHYGIVLMGVMVALRTTGSRLDALSRPLHGLSRKRLRPRVLQLGFGSSALEFEASVRMRDPWTHRIAGSKLRECIWLAFKE